VSPLKLRYRPKAIRGFNIREHQISLTDRVPAILGNTPLIYIEVRSAALPASVCRRAKVTAVATTHEKRPDINIIRLVEWAMLPEVIAQALDKAMPPAVRTDLSGQIDPRRASYWEAFVWCKFGG